MKTCQNAYLCSECVAQKVFPNHTVDTSQLPCYCDHACIRLDDCCSDYKHFCAGKSLFLLILPWLSANEYSWSQVNKGGVFLLLLAKIQQTKLLVTCQRFCHLFLFGLDWQYSLVQTKYNKGRFKVMATYLPQ